MLFYCARNSRASYFSYIVTFYLDSFNTKIYHPSNQTWITCFTYLIDKRMELSTKRELIQ